MIRRLALRILGITDDDLTILRQLPACMPDGLGLGNDPNGVRKWFYGFVARIDNSAPTTFRELARR